MGFDAEFCAAAGAGGDGEGAFAVESWDIDFRAKSGFVEADGEVEINIQAIAAEIGVGVYLGDDVEIAGVTQSMLATATDSQAAAVLHAGGDLDVDGLQLAVAVDLQGNMGSAGGLFEGKSDGVFDVGAAFGGLAAPRGGLSRRAAGLAAAGVAEEMLEEAAEVGALGFDIFNADTRSALPLLGCAAALLGAAEGFPEIGTTASAGFRAGAPWGAWPNSSYCLRSASSERTS